MHLPARILEEVERRLGPGHRVEDVRAVHGGDINEAAVLRTGGDRRWFLKWNRAAPPGMFEAEADGLEALAEAAGRHAPDDLTVPSVAAVDPSSSAGWLLLEFIDGGDDERGEGGGGRSGAGWATRLGRGLAALHRGTAVDASGPGEGDPGGAFGWPRDNFIGRLDQSNTPSTDWAAFWRDRRIAPQLRRAVETGRISGADREDLDRLLARTGEALAGADADGASLLHGDLWGGNVMRAADGRAAIYDPAVYRGHREVDLAMTELFGFPDFMPAYREAWAVDAAYASHRRDLYQLYYLLVHVNLFGGGYRARAVRAAQRVLSAI